MNNRLIWIDLEMTGLDPEKHVIIEIATIVTDDSLDIVAEGPSLAINHPEGVLSAMDEWSRKHHEASGLTDRAKASPYDCGRAEQETLEFLSHHCQEEKPTLCGNSIWQDRRFLAKHMPALHDFFHYRMIDVSSIKELVKRWYPLLPLVEKQKAHLALTDIKESIDELKYYRQNVFLPKGQI
ncbi:MAG: oligoribonuclease [Desulfobacteria bacterium]